MYDDNVCSTSFWYLLHLPQVAMIICLQCCFLVSKCYETFIQSCSWRPLFVSKGLFQPTVFLIIQLSELCSLRWLSSWPLKYPPYKVAGMLARWCSLYHRWAIFVPQSVGVVPEIKYQQRDASETTFVVSWWCSFVSIHLEGRLVHVQ